MINGIKVICIKSDSRRTSYLIDSLAVRQDCPLVTLPDVPQHIATEQNYLCLLDYKTALDNYKLIERITEINKHCFTVIYDAPEHIPTSDLIQLGRLRGYFYSTTDKYLFFIGIRAMMSGERWLPKRISDQLIEYYQTLIIRFHEPYVTNLTQREVQVLEHLRDGHSNNSLADALFVSEHTVKSHLYKIFKKISVANRQQAIAWAHKYLP